jgi:hypothetical protein
MTIRKYRVHPQQRSLELKFKRQVSQLDPTKRITVIYVDGSSRDFDPSEDVYAASSVSGKQAVRAKTKDSNTRLASYPG